MSSPLLIPEPPLQVLPTLAAEVGVNEAIVLQQIHYWSLRKEPDDDGHVWVYNTQAEWLDQFPWLSSATFKRVVSRLREAELIATKQPAGTNRITHYRVLYERLPDGINVIPSTDQFDPMTSNNTETSTESPPKGAPEDPDPVEAVWAVYVEAMQPRRVELDPDERKVIREALKVATAEELRTCILTCSKSDYHMKRGEHQHRRGGKYNALAQIIKPRRGKNETARSRVDFWLERVAVEDRPRFDVNAEQARIRREQGLE